MEDKIYKKYVYISDKIQSKIEEIAKTNKIALTNRYINQYNFEKMLQTELRNINGIDFLIIDLKAIVDSTSEEQIIMKSLERLFIKELIYF